MRSMTRAPAADLMPSLAGLMEELECELCDLALFGLAQGLPVGPDLPHFAALCRFLTVDCKMIRLYILDSYIIKTSTALRTAGPVR